VRSEEDSTVVDEARQGDPQAMELFLESVTPRLLRFSLRLCGRVEDAEDVVQESLLAAARGLSGFRGEASISTWLYSIARSFCIKKRRRKKSIAAVSLDSEAATESRGVPSTDRGPHEALESTRLGAVLEEAIGGLDPAHRDVLLLRDVEGLSAVETALTMGLSVAAVKSRLHRARASVRRKLLPVVAPTAPTPGEGCPDIVRLFSRHLEGEIAPRTCAEMEAHLAGCPACRSGCDSLKATLAACRNTTLPAVPSELRQRIREQIRTYLLQEEGQRDR
jgi:RNA polymerase sigma-70 factor (ECF subfamily)